MALTPLRGQSETVEYDAGYAPASGELFVLTNKLGEFRRLYKWKRGGDLVPVTAEMPKDVSGFGIDDARLRADDTVNDGGDQRLRAIDATTLGELTLPVPQDADSVSVGHDDAGPGGTRRWASRPPRRRDPAMSSTGRHRR